MIATSDTARQTWPCPVALTFADRQRNCRADECPVWRWLRLPADLPEFQAAIAARKKELGGSPHAAHKDAVAWVMERREQLGIPTRPAHGYCGLAGRPEA